MNRVVAISFAVFGLALAGCGSPKVTFTDMAPVPTASLAGRLLTIRVGVDTNIPSSEVWVRIKARVKDNTVYLAGYPSYYREQSREYSVRLPASVESKPVAVVWLNPDGSRVPVPMTK